MYEERLVEDRLVASSHLQQQLAHLSRVITPLSKKVDDLHKLLVHPVIIDLSHDNANSKNPQAHTEGRTEPAAAGGITPEPLAGGTTAVESGTPGQYWLSAAFISR
jgi:hypothetical protein